jgi:hypothetical protein
MRKNCLLLLLALMPVSFLFAQKSGDMGVLGGTTYYIGDLNPAMPFRMTKPAFGILYRQNFNDRLAVRIHGIQGEVAADDALSGGNSDRNLNFHSTLTEFGAQFEVNFLEYFIGSKQHPVTPYLFGGAAVFLFDPYGNVNGNDVRLQPLKTEGQGTAYTDRKDYKPYSFSFPFGIGVKYSISKLFGVGAEWGMRKTVTDYLDDVSTTYYLDLPAGVYPDITSEQKLASDPTLSHMSGMQRGNSRNTDWYSFAGISLTVKIRMLSQERCLDHQREGY